MIAEYFILDDIWLGHRGSTYNVISQRPDLYIFSDLCFLYDGKLVELEYYLNASGSFYFALWRKIDYVDGMEFTNIYSKLITDTAGSHVRMCTSLELCISQCNII